MELLSEWHARVLHKPEGTGSFIATTADVTEAPWKAAIAGHFKVPVIMISGDDAASAEVRSLVGNIEGVETKRSLGFHSAATLTAQAWYVRVAAFTFHPTSVF